MVNLAQSTSSLNITRNIDRDENDSEATDQEEVENVGRFINSKLSQCTSANTATVKTEPESPSAIRPEDLPSTSGITKITKTTVKIDARKKRSLASDKDTEHDIFVNSKSQRLRLITD